MAANAKTMQIPRVSRIDSGTWNELFPKNFGTKDESVLFVKKLLSVSISNIMYLRGAFPESAYVDRDLDNLPLKVLDGKAKCRASRDLISMIRAATDAVEKAYLRELVVAIFRDPEKPEDAVETYTFQFEYQLEDGSGDVVDVAVGFGGAKPVSVAKMRDNVYKSTVRFIRQTLQVTKTLQPLPDDAHLTVMLTYYDGRTPEDYEPSGFSPSETRFKLDQEVDPIATTKVRSKHHGFYLEIRSEEFKEVGETEEVESSGEVQEEEVKEVGETEEEVEEENSGEVQEATAAATTVGEKRKKGSVSVAKRMRVN